MGAFQAMHVRQDIAFDSPQQHGEQRLRRVFLAAISVFSHDGNANTVLFGMIHKSLKRSKWIPVVLVTTLNVVAFQRIHQQSIEHADRVLVPPLATVFAQHSRTMTSREGDGGGAVMMAVRGSCEFVGCVFILGEGELGFGDECA